MVKEERFKYMLATIKKDKKISFESVARALRVSEDTVRRDIEQLHRNGLLTKVRGGAMLRSINPLAFQDRASYLTDGKATIALKTQQLIKTGSTIFMDGGTTICAVAERFPLDASFRVITNNMALYPILSGFSKIEVIFLGGLYNRNTQTNTGIQTCKEAAMFNADLYLMGACAIDKNLSVTASLMEEKDIKKAMLQCSHKTAVLGNWEKLDSTEPFKVCRLEELQVLVTDIPSNDRRLDTFRNQTLTIL